MTITGINEQQWTLTQELARTLIEHEPESVDAFWKPRPIEMFGSAKNPLCAYKSWNAQNAGKRLGSKHNEGYLRVGIFGRDYLLHRILGCCTMAICRLTRSTTSTTTVSITGSAICALQRLPKTNGTQAAALTTPAASLVCTGANVRANGVRKYVLVGKTSILATLTRLRKPPPFARLPR